MSTTQRWPPATFSTPMALTMAESWIGEPTAHSLMASIVPPPAVLRKKHAPFLSGWRLRPENSCMAYSVPSFAVKTQPS